MSLTCSAASYECRFPTERDTLPNTSFDWLRWFEQKNALLSEAFYQLYQRGQLRDEDPDEIREYLEWASWWEIYRDRRRRYQQAIEHQLTTISAPASLDDLHISKLKIPA